MIAVFTKIRDFIVRQLVQVSTWAGSCLAALAVYWPDIKGQMPDMIQQLASTNPGAAKVINIAVASIGFALIVYQEKKTRG